MPIAQGDDVFTVLPATLPERRACAPARRCRRRGGDESRPASAETAPRARPQRPAAARHLCRARHHGGRQNDPACRQDSTTTRPISPWCWCRAGRRDRERRHDRQARRHRTGTGRSALSDAGSRSSARRRAKRSTATGPISIACRRAPAKAATLPTIARSAPARPPRCGMPHRARASLSSPAATRACSPWRRRSARQSKCGPDDWRALERYDHSRHHRDARGRCAHRRAARP